MPIIPLHYAVGLGATAAYDRAQGRFALQLWGKFELQYQAALATLAFWNEQADELKLCEIMPLATTMYRIRQQIMADYTILVQGGTDQWLKRMGQWATRPTKRAMASIYASSMKTKVVSLIAELAAATSMLTNEVQKNLYLKANRHLLPTGQEGWECAQNRKLHPLTPEALKSLEISQEIYDYVLDVLRGTAMLGGHWRMTAQQIKLKAQLSYLDPDGELKTPTGMEDVNDYVPDGEEEAMRPFFGMGDAESWNKFQWRTAAQESRGVKAAAAKWRSNLQRVREKLSNSGRSDASLASSPTGPLDPAPPPPPTDTMPPAPPPTDIMSFPPMHPQPDTMPFPPMPPPTASSAPATQLMGRLSPPARSSPRNPFAETIVRAPRAGTDG
jgi:hypothetical protein